MSFFLLTYSAAAAGECGIRILLRRRRKLRYNNTWIASVDFPSFIKNSAAAAGECGKRGIPHFPHSPAAAAEVARDDNSMIHTGVLGGRAP